MSTCTKDLKDFKKDGREDGKWNLHIRKQNNRSIGSARIATWNLNTTPLAKEPPKSDLKTVALMKEKEIRGENGAHQWRADADPEPGGGGGPLAA